MIALKRAKGVKRVEKDGEVWIARTVSGQEYPEPGFRWNTRSGAWHAAYESDMTDAPALDGGKGE